MKVSLICGVWRRCALVGNVKFNAVFEAFSQLVSLMEFDEQVNDYPAVLFKILSEFNFFDLFRFILQILRFKFMLAPFPIMLIEHF